MPWSAGQNPGEMCVLVTFELISDVCSGMINVQFNYSYLSRLCRKAGFFGKDNKGLALGFIIACCIRFLSSSISGYVFFKEYAPEGWNPIVYTVVYNGSYIFTECVLSLIVVGVEPVRNLLNQFRNKMSK